MCYEIYNIINCIVVVHTIANMTEQFYKQDFISLSLRYPYIEDSCKYEIFYMHIEKRLLRAHFNRRRVRSRFNTKHRQVRYIPDLPLVIDSLLSLGAAILNIF